MNSLPGISVIIVTYNAEHFISLCLDALSKSTCSEKLEILIVDNLSSDETISLIKENYPNVSVIENEHNLGFAKACNIGAEKAKGKFLLFLNPDCIVTESAITLLSKSLEDHNTGLTGPLLIDGSGVVLQETARQIPTLSGAFKKLIGGRLGPGSGYYKTLSKKPFEAPVLSGACMMIREELFRACGGFDEGYFMYGEDIDLSFQVLQTGKTNICNPFAHVIHFKGESTVKSRLSYSMHFYRAMKIFLKKNAPIYNYNKWKWLISPAIFIAMCLNIAKIWIQKLLPLLIDGLLIFLILFGTQYVWSFIKSGELFYFGTDRFLFQYILYTVIWSVALFYQGIYIGKDKRAIDLFKGTIIGMVAILIIYALFPESWRFSRMIIVLSSIFVFVIMYLRYNLFKNDLRREVVIVSNQINAVAIQKKSQELGARIVSIPEVSNLDFETVNLYIDILSVSNDDIFSIMRRGAGTTIFNFWNYKNGRTFESRDADNRGTTAYHFSHYNLSQQIYLIHKRTFDLLFLLVLIVPLLLDSIIRFRFENTGWMDVLLGEKTIVGYGLDIKDPGQLPRLKEGLISCTDMSAKSDLRLKTTHEYANHYSILDDVFISLSKFRLLVSKLH